MADHWTDSLPGEGLTTLMPPMVVRYRVHPNRPGLPGRVGTASHMADISIDRRAILSLGRE